MKLPVGGACPAGTQALYRTYNNGARGDPNHRDSQQTATLQAMAGWVFEGVVMCLPQSQGVSPPSPLPACEEGDCPTNATALGNGVRLVNLVATVTNNSGTAQEIVIPRGQTFTSVNTTYQDGMAAERLQGTIGPGATRTFVLYLFCIDLDRGIPPTGALYLPGPVTGNAQLMDIASLADGKIGIAADPATLKAGGGRRRSSVEASCLTHWMIPAALAFPERRHCVYHTVIANCGKRRQRTPRDEARRPARRTASGHGEAPKRGARRMNSPRRRDPEGLVPDLLRAPPAASRRPARTGRNRK